eukprot:TRINITY_DN5686_c0_g1_i1.p1 TRINITY_DN5686_c0_g1~~TRINITY_DN5686_c0_g1_i1.p1  ORF type:complete len:131 (-),score=6.61 TRINITY_DN5686_c0_g1_i1:51-443(-)
MGSGWLWVLWVLLVDVVLGSSKVFYNTRQQNSLKATTCSRALCSTTSSGKLEDCCTKSSQWCTPLGAVCCGCDSSGTCYDCLSGDFCIGTVGCANSWGIVIISLLVVLVMVSCLVAICCVLRRRKKMQRV